MWSICPVNYFTVLYRQAVGKFEVFYRPMNKSYEETVTEITIIFSDMDAIQLFELMVACQNYLERWKSFYEKNDITIFVYPERMYRFLSGSDRTKDPGCV